VTEATNHLAAVRSAGLAELVWRAADGGPPDAVGVVPLVLGDQPAIALTWAHEATARAVAASAEVALVLSEPRLAGPSWEPLVVRGRATLVEDGDGDLFTERLLDQELRKHPPSRGLADSVLLRREHWWYLPRLVLLLDPVTVRRTSPRQGPDDVVLAVDDGGLHVGVARVEDWAQDPLVLSGGPDDRQGCAALVGQEVTVPDAERWSVHRTAGRYAEARLTVTPPVPDRRLEPVPGLLARVRRQRTLERACVRALRHAGHG
jgi:hypothetical protein